MDIINIILIIVITIVLGLGFIIIHNSREKINKLYFLNILSIIGWGLAIFYYRLSSESNILIWTKILYVSATLIASSFLYFTYVFPVYKTQNLLKKVLIFIPNIVLVLLVIFTDYIIKGAKVTFVGENIIYWGSLYPIYIIYILSYFNFGFYRLFKKIKVTTDKTERLQIVYLLLGYFVSATISFITNLILPSFNYFSLNWVGQISTVLMVVSATYAIVKHHLFSSKVIATELLTFTLWIILLGRLLVGPSIGDHIINGITLLLTFFIGLFLIRSVIKEVNQREKIEKLAVELKKANVRLMEIDRQKSEFVSFATHQLRAPLTAMKGYSSLIMEGEMGHVNKEVAEAVKRIFESSKTLANVVDGYLNISRIELGTMKYTFEMINMKEMVESVIGELKPNIEKSALAFTFSAHPTDPGERFMVRADRDKLKQVIVNLIDNSIKYNPKGSIDIILTKNIHDRKIVFAIKDTGVGIDPEVMPKLFTKFVRAGNANKQNIYGTGLGLYVAKDIVTAHKGHIWAESDGEGKGSQFYMEMDMEV